MSVLVAYSSKHGSTAGIAERIAARLQADGLEAVARPANTVRDAAAYRAYVVGGAAYMFHWMKESTAFVRKNASLLASRPTWLFSSGPLGPDVPDAEGRQPRVTTIPKEMPELEAMVGPKDVHIFFGRWVRGTKPIGLMEHLTNLMPAARNAMPDGDFRDWAEIDAWADAIAKELGGRAETTVEQAR